jgi:hypothetical protein
VWVVLGFFKQVGGRDRRCKVGKEKPSSPAFTRPREEDGKQCHQNGTICCLLFLLTVHETMSLCTKHAISFKRKLHQNMSNSKSVLNFLFVLSSLQFEFKNQFDCIPDKFNR